MQNLDLFLQQNNLKDKKNREQKDHLRKALILKRQNEYENFANKKDWGKKQFLSALKKLDIANQKELNHKFQIACFFPIKCELNFIPFAQPKWLFPKVVHEDLHWFQYGDGVTDYVLNKWKILEKINAFPIEKYESEKKIVCFVPGLAGDVHGHRLGYGKGYYDRFLTHHPEIISVLCLPSEQFFFDKLPHEGHDIKISFIIYS